MHPEPPGDKEHWVTGTDGQTHLTGPNAMALCGHETAGRPIHYRQINTDDEDEWREQVCGECLATIENE